MMTERIRWERIDGTVTSWFGYVGSMKAPLFQILRPVARKPVARTQFHKWALAATFAQDEVRYPETAEGAQAALKAEAEHWLAEFVFSLGAVFPEFDESAAFQLAEARDVLARWDAGQDGEPVHSREKVLADQVRTLLAITGRLLPAEEVSMG